jgi:hypothetical protein
MSDSDTPAHEQQKLPTPKQKKRGRGRSRGSKTKRDETVPRLGLRVDEFMRTYGVSRSAVYGGIRSGEIKTAKLGKIRILFPLKQSSPR